MSTLRRSLSSSSKTSAVEFGAVRSFAITRTPIPCLTASSRARSSRASRRRATKMRSCPSTARSFANSRPMPLDAPVTRAAFRGLRRFTIFRCYRRKPATAGWQLDSHQLTSETTAIRGEVGEWLESEAGDAGRRQRRLGGVTPAGGRRPQPLVATHQPSTKKREFYHSRRGGGGG